MHACPSSQEAADDLAQAAEEEDAAGELAALACQLGESQHLEGAEGEAPRGGGYTAAVQNLLQATSVLAQLSQWAELALTLARQQPGAPGGAGGAHAWPAHGGLDQSPTHPHSPRTGGAPGGPLLMHPTASPLSSPSAPAPAAAAAAAPGGSAMAAGGQLAGRLGRAASLSCRRQPRSFE